MDPATFGGEGEMEIFFRHLLFQSSCKLIYKVKTNES